MLALPQIGNNTIKLPLRKISQTNMANEHPENDINIVQLLKVAANILQTGFITAPKVRANREFKKLKQGKSIQAGTLNIGQLKDV